MLHRRRIAIAFSAWLFSAAVPGSGQVFVFHLSGDQEVPPVPSTATGGCYGDLDPVGATFELFCSHDVVGASLIHVHEGAAGVNGPALFDLGDPASPVHATWTGMTPAEVAAVQAGDLYVNIHTGGRPAGEIRGQILPRTVDLVAFDLDGGQVVPPTVSAATGSCTADLDDAATSLSVDCMHGVASPTAAHLHEAPPGENGPVVFAFASAASPFSGDAPLTPQQVASFAGGILAVDVHSVDVPDGEIRGQVGTAPGGATTGTIRIRKVTYPAGGTGFAFSDDVPGSLGGFTLDDGGIETFSAVPPGTFTVTETDPDATPGGYDLTDLACDDADSTGDRITGAATIRLEAGELVTCTFVNTAAAPTGEIFAFALSGGQEVPPLASPASGGCAGLFDAGASTLTLLCVHDVIDATVMHVHRGAAGANGPVAFDLGAPQSPVQAVWSGMTPADVADLLAGNLYVNIHTAGRPSGEIRGQIVPRSIETFQFALGGDQVVPPGPSPYDGACTAVLDGAATALAIDCLHDLSGALAAHVHSAPAGENGPVLFTFPDPSSPLTGTVPLGLRDLAELLAGFLYLDVHGAEEQGEIRGQIVEDSLTGVPEIPVLDRVGLLLLALALGALAARRLTG